MNHTVQLQYANLLSVLRLGYFHSDGMRPILRYLPQWRQHLSPAPHTASISRHTHNLLLSHHGHPPSSSTSYSTSPQTQPLVYPDAPSNSSEHHDLASYAAYAARTGLDLTSKTYVGTRYEYAVVAALSTLGFTLRRIGGRDDCGIDLLGTWEVPSSTSDSNPLRVLLQCKASASQSTRIGPQHIRELAGAFAGAPPGWRSSSPGSSVLGFLVAQKPATKGVRDALGRSRWPMGYVSCSQDGKLEQMLWNRRAEEEGLEGLGVGVRFCEDNEGRSEQQLVLTWKGKPYMLNPASTSESA
ncbi:hypothetical protein F5Y06DRAFT_283450 [Hypoxylon sp. FL0890]|nr:hypothetical protein F5Y06DRAFT_283450 [Hypoxylon sp. FL0890]